MYHNLRVVMCCIKWLGSHKATLIPVSRLSSNVNIIHHFIPSTSPAQPSPAQPSPVSRLSALYCARGGEQMEILFITVSHAPSVGTPSISPASPCQQNIYSLYIYDLYCGGINWQYLGLLPSMELVSPVPSSHSALTVSALDLEGHYSFFTFYTSQLYPV